MHFNHSFHRYRKIPADICVENKSDQNKYGKTEAPCQSAAPSKLSIVLQSRKLPAGKAVTFLLEQAGVSTFFVSLKTQAQLCNLAIVFVVFVTVGISF